MRKAWRLLCVHTVTLPGRFGSLYTRNAAEALAFLVSEWQRIPDGDVIESGASVSGMGLPEAVRGERPNVHTRWRPLVISVSKEMHVCVS
jgi:hypothetical protein